MMGSVCVDCVESVCVDYNYIKGACICDGECLCRL